MTKCRLYLISPPKFELSSFKEDLKQALSGGDVAAFQLRMKDVSREEIREAAKILLPIAKEKNTAFIINDDYELAIELAADGVHVGHEDGVIEEDFISNLRTKVHDNFVIGTSCYDSRHIAMETAEQGADYVSFGAFFPSKTKLSPRGKPETEILEWWSTYTNVPCVAIGGIDKDNCASLVKAGADFIAVISAVWQHSLGPEQAIQEINAAIETAIANT